MWRNDIATKELSVLKTSSARAVLRQEPGHLRRLLDQWGGVPEHLAQNFSRYVDVPTQGGNGGNGLDLSGGSALAQKVWEEFDAGTMAERGIIVAGDPESCIKAARLHEATGVDQLQFLMATESVPHKKVMESIEMFGKHVIPHIPQVDQECGVPDPVNAE